MDKDLTEVEKLAEWKDKKQRNRDNKLKNSKKIFVRRRKWRDEVDEIKELEKSYEEFDIAKAEHFNDFPLSSKTKMGLEKAKYTTPTAIQRASFLPSVKGGDILGAAKTGSGKTLAFLLPVLECLFRQRWTAIAGPGALIISPTRELAYQTFEVLKKVGLYHDFSAGLVIGGKDVKSEAAHMCRTNILVCTPGRLLQHMDETSYFDASSLQILVLDEADRILDLGFKATVNAILENLPTDKQTLLFSATQTKSVKDLARLSLKNPSYISVHEKSRTSTPSGLNQKYIVCKLEDKLNVLYSFVKNHLKAKTIVFLTSCKQVQYIYAAFCKLRPGVPIMMLHGRMHQMKRMAVYEEFCRKQFALLFCTDVAARGLDIPAVDWVVQLDCPEDAETYIHRAGRTARNHGEGQALLLLLESEEEAMVKQMQDRKVPISKTEINLEKITKINSRLESFCAAELELKEKAQRCFVSYIRSIFLMKNKSVFSVQSLSFSEYAASLGLAVTPRVRFLQRQKKQGQSNFNEKVEKKNPENNNGNKDVVNTSSTLFTADDVSSDNEGDMFVVKRKDVFGLGSSSTVEEKTEISTAQKDDNKTLSKAAQAKKLLKKKYKYNQKILFDKDGELTEAWPPVDPNQYKNITENIDEGDEDGIDIEKVKLEMKERDTSDRQRHRDKIRQKHQEKRRKDKELRRQLQAKKEGRYYGKDNEEEVIAFLGSPDSSEVDESNPREFAKRDDVTVNSETIPLKRSSYHLRGDEDEKESRSKRINVDGSATLSDLMNDAGLSLREEEDLALHFLKQN